jgi:hypothetical protein
MLHAKSQQPGCASQSKLGGRDGSFVAASLVQAWSSAPPPRRNCSSNTARSLKLSRHLPHTELLPLVCQASAAARPPSAGVRPQRLSWPLGPAQSTWRGLHLPSVAPCPQQQTRSSAVHDPTLPVQIWQPRLWPQSPASIRSSAALGWRLFAH